MKEAKFKEDVFQHTELFKIHLPYRQFFASYCESQI